MKDEGKNSRRNLLKTSTALVGGIGVGGIAVPFLGTFSPSARAKAEGADVDIDIGGLAPGQLLVEQWRRMPVWILRRTTDMLKDLEVYEDQLKDPNSERESQQPSYAVNRYRSIKPEYLIVMGVCTHLGCSPGFKPEHGVVEIGDWWKGGFFCSCHGSEYDLSGRVFKGRSPAPLNLPVPPHKFLSETKIRVGDQSESI